MNKFPPPPVPRGSIEARLQQALQLHNQGHLAQAADLYRSIVDQAPRHFHAFHMLGLIALQQQRFDEAERLLSQSLAIKASNPAAHDHRGVALLNLGRAAEALQSYDKSIALNPKNAEVFSNRGNALIELGRIEEALASFEKTLATEPRHALALYNRGNALLALKRPAEAVASYDKAIAARPAFAEAQTNRGNALVALGRFPEAVESYERALAIVPQLFVALNERGKILMELGRPDAALVSLDKAVAVAPDSFEAHYNRGNALSSLDRAEEAIASYDRALAVRPDLAEALVNRGGVLRRLGRMDEALNNYDQALALRPNFAEAFVNRGFTLVKVQRYEEALSDFDRALAIKPNFGDALNNRGSVLQYMDRYDEAAEAFTRLLQVNPNFEATIGNISSSRMRCCDWRDFESLSQEIVAQIDQGRYAITPWMFLIHSPSPAKQLTCARIYTQKLGLAAADPVWKGEVYNHPKIRVAYLSADFHTHATSYLMASLFEAHDRDRFEIYGISFGRDETSPMRDRLRAAFDQFIEVRARGDREVAMLLRELEIDIAVDLKGYTNEARPAILAQRGAPIQVSYLGYPGTMGADFIDYLIADRRLIPAEHEAFYSEKVVCLPESYQVNDNSRRIAPLTLTRQDFGLPAEAFVFCSFNNNYKIAPPVFAVWMRLLQAVEGSVLWLLQGNPAAAGNLRREAAQHGVDPARLVFAPALTLEDHLARHKLADLFLDTLPCNAHTTASDALWAGLPVVTCMGDTFAGRVAGSLLHAVGLPELAVHSLEEYESLALMFAKTPDTLDAVRTKLVRNRDSCPLFDTDRFCRHLESAFATMSDRLRRGETPAAFSVAAG